MEGVGGCLLVLDGASVTIARSALSDCVASGSAGAIGGKREPGLVELRGSVVTRGCEARDDGAALALPRAGSKLRASGLVSSDDSAEDRGGTVYAARALGCRCLC
eukprot:1486674-Rhodomonas_salina.1